MDVRIKAQLGDAFQATPEAIHDKSTWPDWLQELWAEPFAAANTVMELNRGHLVLKTSGGIQGVAPFDWIVRLENGAAFAVSDPVLALLTGRVV